MVPGEEGDGNIVGETRSKSVSEGMNMLKSISEGVNIKTKETESRKHNGGGMDGCNEE